MNLLSGIISTVLSLGISLIFSFLVMIALNGFTGTSADYAIYTYLICAIILALTVGAMSFLATGFFIKRGWNTAVAMTLPIIAGLILSAIGSFIGMVIAGIVADTMWKK